MTRRRPQAVRPRRSPAPDWLSVAIEATLFGALVSIAIAILFLLDALLAVLR